MKISKTAKKLLEKVPPLFYKLADDSEELTRNLRETAKLLEDETKHLQTFDLPNNSQKT